MVVLRVADIYCGAGGLSEGFRRARLDGTEGTNHFEVVYAVDKDADCMDTYRANHFPGVESARLDLVAPCHEVAGLTKAEVEPAGGGHIHVIVGGPNCQGVSSAGLRNASDPRNDRFEEFRSLIEDLQPEWFVMENVPGLTHANNRELLYAIMRAFSNLRGGYRVAADVLLASDFGCAQFRYRLFVIGTRTTAPIRFPAPTHDRPVARGRPIRLPLELQRCQNVRDGIWDLKEITPNIAGKHDTLKPGADQMVPNHVVPTMSEENKCRIQAVAPGEDWRSIPVGRLPDRYFSTRASDQKGAYGRLSWDFPAFTIIALSGNVSAGAFTHPSLDRPISVREAARLQGFPDEYIFSGDVSSLYRQVGNAVPPPLARAVAGAILRCHVHPQESREWGHEGRITLKLLEESRGARVFPVLTPRFPSAGLFAPRTRHRRPRLEAIKEVAREAAPCPVFAADPVRRAPPVEWSLDRLRREAKQPGNVRGGKRARAILGYFEGKTMDELRTQSRVSEVSIQKWVEGYYRAGPEGWRAYHTPLNVLAGGDLDLLGRLERAVAQARDHNPDTADLMDVAGQKVGRAHMNTYLRSLIERYGQRSVKDLVTAVREELGQDVGTVYVSDLLAICDVVLCGTPVAMPAREAVSALCSAAALA